MRGIFLILVSSQDEDYRWAVLRQRIPAWFFHVVNFTFIGRSLRAFLAWAEADQWTPSAFIQNVILLLLGIPTYIAVFQQPTKLATSDYVLAILALIDLVVEFTADNQQYSFQTFKHSGVREVNEWPFANPGWTAADVKRGFVTKGLWAWSRHPNFLCEQSFWVRCLLLWTTVGANIYITGHHHTLPDPRSGVTPPVSFIDFISYSHLATCSCPGVVLTILLFDTLH